jgi:argininosuccinate lyase
MSSEFRWVRLPDAFCTGSSIMPQKKNPDLAELARGKSGRLLGHVVALGTVLKGLPLTYNKDLQEDKEPVFDAYTTAYDLVDTWQQMVAEMQVNATQMAAGFKGGHLLATDLADFLVREKDVPFREAHHIVGTAVALAERLGCDVSDLSLKQLKELDSRLDKAAKLALRIETSLNSRARFGGPAPKQVAKNIAATRAALGAVPTHDPVFSWAFELSLPSFLP